MVESKKKKRAPPPKPTAVEDAARDSGVGKSPQATTQKPKKKRAPLPAPVKARQLSNSGQAVAMPITDIKTIQMGKEKLTSAQKTPSVSSSINGDDFAAASSKTPSRITFSEHMMDDDGDFFSDPVFGTSDAKNEDKKEKSPTPEPVFEPEEEIASEPEVEPEPELEPEPEPEPEPDPEPEPIQALSDDGSTVDYVSDIEEDPKIEVILEEPNKQKNADNELQKQQTNPPNQNEEETNFDDLFGSDSEFTETEDFSDRSGEKEADTGFFEGSTKSDCDAKSEIMEEKKTVVKISPVAEQKVEIQEERKTSFTIVPQTGKAQLAAVNRDQKQSIYASVNKAQIMEQTSSAKGHAAILSELSSLKDQIAALKNKNSKAQVPYTVTKAVHKFRNQNERPIPSQKPPIAAKPKSRQGSASLQLDEQGNIVREGSVSSTKSPSPVQAASKPVTTMPLDQNGNIRIVDKKRTDAHAFEIPKLKPVYSSQQFQQIPQVNQPQTQQQSHPMYPQQVNPAYPQMDPRMSYQYIPQYQPAPQQMNYQPGQSMDAQQYQQYVAQHQRMMQYHNQQQQQQQFQQQQAQAQFGAYQNQQSFQNHQQPKFQPILAQQSLNPQSQGAAPIESVYGPSRSISESGSAATLARGYFPASQINNSRSMKTSVNSSMSSPSPSMSSEEGGAQDVKTNAANASFPFGKKLSLKKPQQRERIVTQTPREQLLNEVQTIAHARSDTAAAIPAGFVRQLSQSSNNPQNAEMPQPPAAPIFLKPASQRKLKEKKEELSTHEELMRQISRSRTVPDQFIADGTVKSTANGVPPPPPAPIAPPQLKKVNVKQLPKVQQLTPQEALLSEIRSRGNKSSEHVFDGTNKEKLPSTSAPVPVAPPAPVANLKPVPKNVNQKPLPAKEEDPRDFLLSQIRSGFTLKPVQN